MLGSFDYFGLETRQDLGERVRKKEPLIGAVGKQLLEDGNRPYIVANSEMPPSRS